VNTVVFGISPDDEKKLTKFEEKQSLNFDLLSDPENVVSTKYGAYGLKKFMGREYMGVKRMTFIVGKDGKLKHVMDKVNTKSHHDDILEYIEGNL
jgi:peroxiredoxin Q/BCP